MVYINSDGNIGDKPWYRQITLLFGWVVQFVSAFFRTLLSPITDGLGSQYDSNSQRPWGSGPGGPPRPPRRMGRFATLSSCQAPMPGGG